MTLRRKTFLAIALSLAGLMAVLAGSLGFILLESFEQLEQDQAGRDLERVRQGIAGDLDQLRRTAIDWGVWDATYGFARRERPEYAQENLSDPKVLDYLRVDLLAIADTQGWLLFAQELEPGGEALLPAAPNLTESLAPRGRLTAYAEAGDYSLQGLERLPRQGGGTQPMLVVAQGVLPSDRQGPPAGTLLMARRMDAEWLAGIAQRTQLHLRLLDLYGEIPPSLEPVVRNLRAAGGDAAYFAPEDDERLMAYSLLRDLRGEPMLLLALEIPRQTYLEGRHALRYLVFALLAIGLGFGGVTLWLLERLVLVRLARLSDEVDRIGTAAPADARVTAEGDDELTRLAHAVNDMLVRLSEAMREQARQRARIEDLLMDALPAGITKELKGNGRPSHGEEQLRRAVGLAQAAERAKDEFLASISHEIRTPMNAILNLTRICLQDELTDRQRARLEKVARSSDSLLALINEILDFSRIEAGRLELERLAFRPADLLAGLEAHAGEARERGLWFQAGLEPGMPPALRGDPLRLQQVLRNLVGNAVKFTSQGGVEVLIRPLHREGQRIWLELRVRDTGMGISTDKLASIFDPFSQGDRSTTRRFGGSGLGLAICRRLVQAMGGSITVESRIGEGSLFQAQVPLELAEEAELPAGEVAAYPAERLERLRGRRILLVEDDQVNQAVALELLELAGIQAALAANGREAVRMAGAGGYELILMDLHMPEMDGYQASREIRALPGLADIPILALTATSPGDAVRRCQEAGMNDLVTKPIVPAAFYDSLIRWLSPRTEAKVPPAEIQTRVTRLSGHPELRALFLSHHRYSGEAIRQALERGDRGAARRLAHNLKSAAGTLGEGRLFALAQALEVALRDDAADPAPALPQEIAAELAAIPLRWGEAASSPEGAVHSLPSQ
jgi:signal transduction histidine kinase/DNA-binding NarL/FixJ family response regulator